MYLLHRSPTAVFLQAQATYDLLYLLANVPAFVVPALLSESHGYSLVPFMPAVLPFLHIFLTGGRR